jgi:hypothetical protein
MVSHRLSRLTLLTQGAALVGLGLSHLACGNDPPVASPTNPVNEPTHVNAPAPPASEAASAPTPPPPHTMNAPADVGPTDAGAPPPGPPKTPLHVNSPPKQPKKP